MLISADIWPLLQSCPEPVVAYVAQLLEDKEQLEQENARLRVQNNQNSGNSHVPPSKNIFKKNFSLRKKTGRKPGGQPGHPGATLRRSENPDVIVEHQAHTCEHCHASIPEDTPVIDQETRQEIEIEIRRVVREHRCGIVLCPDCGKRTKGAFPQDVNHYLQYGPSYKALMLYLNQGNFVPFERLAQFSADVLHVPVSVGTLVRFVQEARVGLSQPLQTIREQIIKAPVAYFDETGTRVAGKLHWRHTAGTDQYVCFYTHKKRGKEAMIDMGILPVFTGYAMHDFLKSYFFFLSCGHALCNAHLLRELNGIEENDKQLWPQKMKEVLLDAKALRDTTASWPLPQPELQTLSRRYNEAIQLGLEENPERILLPDAPKKRGRNPKTKARNLLDRMKQFKDNILLFLHEQDVNFDNNASERNLRMSKTQQKVSGCFRSGDGCVAFDDFHSYLATARKHDISAYDAVYALTSGQPLFSQPP